MYPQQQYPGQYPYGGSPYVPAPGYPPMPTQYPPMPAQYPQAPARQAPARWSGGDAFAATGQKRASVSFNGAPVGTTVILLVDGLPYCVQGTKWVQPRPGQPAQRGELEFWPDGHPKWVVGTPGINANGEKVTWWARRPSAGYRAAVEAQESTGLKLQRSRVVAIKYVRDEPTAGNPQKIYEVSIVDIEAGWSALTPQQQAVYLEWTRNATADAEDDPTDPREEKERRASEQAQPAPQVQPQGFPQAAPQAQQQTPFPGQPQGFPQAAPQVQQQTPFPGQPQGFPQAAPQVQPQTPFPGQPAPQAQPQAPQAGQVGLPPDVLAAMAAMPDADIAAMGHDVGAIRAAIESAKASGALPPF